MLVEIRELAGSSTDGEAAVTVVEWTPRLRLWKMKEIFSMTAGFGSDEAGTW